MVIVTGMQQPRACGGHEAEHSVMTDSTQRCGHCGLPHEVGLRVCPTTGLRIDQDGPRPRMMRVGPTPTARRPDASELVGQRIDDKYEIRGVLGEGGQSVVYDAMHLGLERAVAIKLLHPGQASDPKAMARIRNEAQVVSAIRHPNICEIFDLGQTRQGSPYLVMERLVGETLAVEIAHKAPIGFLDLAPTLKQVLAALAFAHERGVLHRDLKPENVFLERRRGQLLVKLLDFGISRWLGAVEGAEGNLGLSDTIACTPYYMSPEQARGDSSIDHRVDLWAVGVILYEALTARRPFVATNYNALLVRILTSQPRPVERLQPELHPAIAELAARALAKAREDRFQSANEFRQAVSEVQELCLTEDSYAPTVVMRRRKRGPTPAPRMRAQAWAGRIDDPDTFIDDGAAPGHGAGPHGAAEEAARGQADKTAAITSGYLHGRGVMRLPPPPRVEQFAPQAPASFARLHTVDDLVPSVAADQRRLSGDRERGATAGPVARKPPTLLEGPKPLFDPATLASPSRNASGGKADPLLQERPMAGPIAALPVRGERGEPRGDDSAASAAAWDDDTHTDIMLKPPGSAEVEPPDEPHRPGPGR